MALQLPDLLLIVSCATRILTDIKFLVRHHDMVQPEKMSSQFRLGGPVCRDPAIPKSDSSWARQKMLYGSMEVDRDSYPKPVVSDRKARELAGHTNLFGTPPFCSTPCAPVKVTSISEIHLETIGIPRVILASSWLSVKF